MKTNLQQCITAITTEFILVFFVAHPIVATIGLRIKN